MGNYKLNLLRMKIRIIILFVALVAVSFLSGYAQTGNYEQRVNGRAMGYTKYPPMAGGGLSTMPAI